MQRRYDGRCACLSIDANGHLWIDYYDGDVQPVPFCYSAGIHSIVLPLDTVRDLGPETYGQFTLDAAAQGIAVMPEVRARARAEWIVEQQERSTG
jgi:hypothetical protein